MIEIEIPGFGSLTIKNVVFDFNGTLAIDGKLINGVKEKLNLLANQLEIYVLTADTFGMASAQLEGIPCQLKILSGADEAGQKEKFVKDLGTENICAFGNGNNDQKMLTAVRLGIAIIEGEGCSKQALQSADLIVSSIAQGIDLLLNPMMLKATLRL